MKSNILSKTKVFLGLALFTLAGGFAGAWMYQSLLSNPNHELVRESAPVSIPAMKTSGAPGPSAVDFSFAADKTIHSVVHVKTTYAAQTGQHHPYYFFNPFHDFYFDQREHGNPKGRESSGSGVIISSDGYVVTNNHVIDQASEIEVTLNDKRSFKAKLVGKDPSSDLALLKIDENNLPFLTYGNSENLKIGEWVLAVGNPFNLTSTVTAGIVSAKARNINILNSNYKIESFIQTDAAVNPGNSGGALVNIYGELVGINAAIASNTGSYSGYSFAIPTTLVKKVVGDLLQFGSVQRGFIGVNIRDIDAGLAEEKGLKQYKGVYVEGLREGGAARDAGIKEGDVITRVGGVEVNSSPELQEQVGKYRPGDKVNVTLSRANKEMVVPVTLKNQRGDTEIIKKDPEAITHLLGCEMGSPSEEETKKLEISGGVKIKRLGPGKLKNAGIREGFIITKIDRKEVTSAEELVDALSNRSGAILLEGVYPNGLSAYYAFGL